MNKEFESTTESVYISRASDPELFKYIMQLKKDKKSVSAFFKEAALNYMNKDTMDIDERIRYIIDTEYANTLKGKSSVNTVANKFSDIYDD